MPGGYLHRSWDPLERKDDQPGFEANPNMPEHLRGDEVWLSQRYQCVVRYATPNAPPAEWESAGGEYRATCQLCDHWIRAEDEEVVNDGMADHMRDEHRHRGGLLHLSIHARDRGPMRNWRHLQQIKNEVAGELRTAVEIFPPEDQLTDSANEYHLWVFPEGTHLPFGMDDAALVSSDEAVEKYNAAPHQGHQEPWEPGLTTGRTEHSESARERLDEALEPRS